MSSQRIERTALCAAIALGFGESTGTVFGMVVGIGMPIVCSMPGTRRAAWKCAIGYYTAALWPMVAGLERFFPDANVLFSIAFWPATATLLSLPWALVWTCERPQYIWRVPLALLITVLPPLGIVGLASPLVGAGYVFPGTGWAGVGATALLPGVILSISALGFHHRRVIGSVAGTVALSVLCGAFSSRLSVETPIGWTAINTHFGDVSKPFHEFAAAEFIREKAAESSAHVLIFPESVIPRWSASTEAFWRGSIEHAREQRQIVAVGAGVPVRSQPRQRDSKELPRKYDFESAIDVLKGVPTFNSRLGVVNSRFMSTEAVENTLLILGAGTGTFRQRVPVPIGMWIPFSRTSVPLRPAGSGILTIDNQRAAVLICYEQLIPFPILASMFQHPTVIVGVSNTFWVEGTSIPKFQANALRAWARLFRLPFLSAVNS